jgi:hypothetical protein
MSYENHRRKSHESPDLDDETREQLFAARDLMNPIKTVLEQYYISSDSNTKQEAFAQFHTLLLKLRSEYDDLLTKIDTTAGDTTGHIILMLLIQSFLDEFEHELALLS